MDERELSELRQMLVEEISLPLRSLIVRMDKLQSMMEDWRQSSEDRLASFKREQPVRNFANVA